MKKRLQQLGSVLQLMRRTENELDAKQVLSVVESYSTALDLLDEYDHQKMKRPGGKKAVYVLTYDECRALIESMRFLRNQICSVWRRMIHSRVPSGTYISPLPDRRSIRHSKKKRRTCCTW